MTKSILALTCIWVVALCACGKMNDAMNATTQVPQKMDGMLNSMDGMRKDMGNLKSAQTESVTFEAMLNSKYGGNIYPASGVPYDLLGFAQKFAADSPSNDFIQTVDLWLKKLNGNPPPTPNGVKDPTTGNDPVTDAYNQKQMQTLIALEAICGFLSDQQTQQIINDQIYGAGEYQDAAYQMLMLRFNFLHDIYLEKLKLASPMDSAGALVATVKSANSLEMIVRLPFVANIQLNANIMYTPAYSINQTMDTSHISEVLGVWTTVKTNAERDLAGFSVQKLTGDSAQDQALFKTHQQQIADAMATVNQRIAGWAPIKKP